MGWGDPRQLPLAGSARVGSGRRARATLRPKAPSQIRGCHPTLPRAHPPHPCWPPAAFLPGYPRAVPRPLQRGGDAELLHRRETGVGSVAGPKRHSALVASSPSGSQTLVTPQVIVCPGCGAALGLRARNVKKPKTALTLNSAGLTQPRRWRPRPRLTCTKMEKPQVLPEATSLDGIEPSTCGLRIRCSATELQAQREQR